jgi:hypothetical protein
VKAKAKAQAAKPQQSRHRNRFRRVETKRLIRACREEGLSIARIECDGATGKVSIIPGVPVESASTDDNPWDSVLTK